VDRLILGLTGWAQVNGGGMSCLFLRRWNWMWNIWRENHFGLIFILFG
jgi:hypothetical protein